MVKLLIFDMDGTLIDTDEVLYETWKELFKLYKPKDYKIDREFVRGFSGPPVMDSIKLAFPEKDPDFILKEYRTRTAKYYDMDYLKLFPNELPVLRKLHEEGYLFAIATSKNREMALKTLEKYDSENMFSLILTSSDHFKTKPDPEMLNYIIDKLNVSKDETIMIGDTKFDYLAAENAKIKCILFKGAPRHYDSETKPYKIVDSYEELYKVIKNLEK